ncbi:hypothetical protein [Asanoa iriomotensis]|uniref:Uncharacterized protein n=1 Tax=Asanoa iriomotensis TaxID=234613 RepID=A0ABQ4CBQ7_9ACTN|nr:hypothetical protein [Asanoa iriomotensis]GIF60199.1 hypothetical protein Air01nite_62940 [Asanoa iriomotensis]
MAWEWVAPVATASAGAAGVFFTWLTGAQSRRHVERLTQRTEDAARRERSIQERRDAYLAALKVCRLDLARARYERKGDDEKLAEVHKSFPKGERVRMSIDAQIAVETFGSVAARRATARWADAAGEGEERMREVYEQLVALARAELGAEALDETLPARPVELPRARATRGYE